MTISDPDRRSFYEKECERSGWSVREMKRQMATSLFERLLLSDGKANREKVLALAAKGQEIAAPEDIVASIHHPTKSFKTQDDDRQQTLFCIDPPALQVQAFSDKHHLRTVPTTAQG